MSLGHIQRFAPSMLITRYAARREFETAALYRESG
jgi:hypothetical protein